MALVKMLTASAVWASFMQIRRKAQRQLSFRWVSHRGSKSKSKVIMVEKTKNHKKGPSRKARQENRDSENPRAATVSGASQTKPTTIRPQRNEPKQFN